VIPLHWDDAKQVLTIGERVGTFSGMLEKRMFGVVLVDENHGAGIAPSEHVERIIFYNGKMTTFPQ